MIRSSISASCSWLCCIGLYHVPYLYRTYSLALLLAFRVVDSHFYADGCQIYLPIADIDETTTSLVFHSSSKQCCSLGSSYCVGEVFIEFFDFPCLIYFLCILVWGYFPLGALDQIIYKDLDKRMQVKGD